MFEFHGWAVLLGDDGDGVLSPAALAAVAAAVREAADGISLLDVAQGGNGLTVLRLHGLRNHHQAAVLALFRQVALLLPCSYGVLFIHDPERAANTEGFQGFRMAHGQVEEFPDQPLSSCYTTSEPPHDAIGCT